MTTNSDDILDRYIQTRRVMKLYLRIANSRFGLTPRDLVHDADVCRRTVYRDLAFLKDEQLIESRGGKLFKRS